MKRSDHVHLEKIDDWRWRIPRTGKMRTDGVIYTSEALLPGIQGDPCVTQVQNVAHLPGILGSSLAMPDIHWGYGFPIGGVAATDPENDGVVSPGGIGYDINCGVRLLRSGLHRDELTRPRLKTLVDGLFKAIPAGTGSARKDRSVSDKEFTRAITEGARWAVARGWGRETDLDHIEEGGAFAGADPDKISARARQRGRPQIGTLGSGNHFCEVGYIDEIYDEAAAAALGLTIGQVSVIIHTGSRGFGHQVCSDFLKVMEGATRRYGIDLPDRQLCCAPLDSPEGKDYLAAMACAVNFAFANRQLITHAVRECFETSLGAKPEDLKLGVIYDVCHNIGKFEEHAVASPGGGEHPRETRRVFVHRKGATRSFGPGHAKTPSAYRGVGQPVLIPGDMGRYSYILTGTEQAMTETWGSTCHGAGRVLSRGAAKKMARKRNIVAELADAGILVRAASRATVVEEMPEAYKDVASVVDVVAGAGISRKVARHRPLAVVKG